MNKKSEESEKYIFCKLISQKEYEKQKFERDVNDRLAILEEKHSDMFRMQMQLLNRLSELNVKLIMLEDERKRRFFR